MRKFYLPFTLVVAMLITSSGYAQDFSNKGKDFYLCFPAHVPSSNNATLSIWITSDKASSGTITMGNGNYSNTFNIVANGLAEIQVPWSAAHVSNAESNMVIRKSIRVKVDPGKPAVVAYAQQWAGARSDATLLLPVNVLGKKYYSVNFTQNAAAGGRSQFDIIAIKDNTVVQITPIVNGIKSPAVIINLPLSGDMYQYQITGALAATGDLTGTYIESIASASGGCVPIAVFSGSSNDAFGTSSCGSFTSYDPLLQQAYPVSTWGKNFGFIPFSNYPAGNPYRVLASEDNTSVYFDGSLVAILNAGQIYPAAFTSQPAVLQQPTNITADKPVCVAQYMQSNGCNGAGNIQGDPDMVLLNPIEQSIKDITIFSTRQQVINQQWINVLLKTVATPSFKISRNGGPLNSPGSSWQPIASLPGYSYLREQLPTPSVISDSYRLVADSGFNAICYGLGDNESYAYSAGTYIKDLYLQTGVASTYGIETDASVCVGEQFKFKISLPYLADSIAWDFSHLPTPTPPNITVHYSSPPVLADADSVTYVNGKPIYWYSVPVTYTASLSGTYPVSLTAYAPNADGCGNEEDIDFDLQVYDPPVADFSWANVSCAAEPMHFTETTAQTPKTTYNFWWDFGDPASGIGNNTSNVRNPIHTFSGPGTYHVRFSDITTPGCVSDTVAHDITVTGLPTATIDGTTTVCLNQPPPNITFTATGGTAPYTFTYTIDNGSGPGPNQTITTVSGNSITLPVLTNVVGTFRYDLVSVKNAGSAFCSQNQTGFAIVTVAPDASITLTSPASTPTQTVCQNVAIATITYAIGGGGTGGTVTGLPTGVTGTYVGGVLTISGTPTVTGSFPFTASTAGNCTQATATGTLTVNADATLNLTSAPATTNQSLCPNTAITAITYAVGGGGSNATVTGLPTGVTGVYAGGVVTISGTPSVTGTFNYTVSTTGTCVQKTATGVLTINSDATITLSSAASTSSQSVCQNIAIVNITYAIGGSGSGGTVSGLPAGVTGTYSGGVFTISGTPTAPGNFPYTVSTIGGVCGPVTANGSITVNADASILLTSAAGSSTQSVCPNTAIANITYAIGGGGNNATVAGLPAGVTGTYSGGVFTITGTPTVISGTFNYTVTTTGTCAQKTATGSITINPDATINLSSPVATAAQTLCQNIAITNITYAIGGAGNNATVTGLPTGVTGAYSAGVFTISGIPTVSGSFSYTVTATGGACAQKTSTGTITVNPDATINLTSAAGTSTQSVCPNTAITNITYSIGGGGSNATVAGLPAGVTGTYSAGVFTITGTPTAITGTFNYTVTTTGTCAQKTATGSITINPAVTINLSSPAASANQTLCQNIAIATITYAIGGAGNNATITGLPTGVTGSYSAGVFTITGSPTVTGTFNYTVTATGGVCAPKTSTGTIIVNPDATINLTSAAGTSAQSICANTAISGITYAIGGGGTNATVTGLPVGVTGTYAAGVFTISGTPTVASGSFSYTVTTSGTCAQKTATGTITVNADATVSLSSPAATATQTVCQNIAITNISYAIGGAGTSATVTGLPTGVTGAYSAGVFTISGTPTVAGSFPYTVTATGGSCAQKQSNGTITVNPDATIVLTSGASSLTQTVCINTAISNISYVIGGGGTGATVTGLPAGVTGTYSSGVFTISGTPAASGPFNFTVTTSGTCGQKTYTGSMTINPLPTADFNASLPDCVAGLVSFTDGSVPNAGALNNWQWNFADPASGGNNISNLQNPVHTFSATGNYNVTLTVSTDKGCSSVIKTKQVVINPRPKAGFMTPQVCVSDLIMPFTDTSKIVTGNITGWSWNFGDPNATPGNPNTSVQQNPNHYYSVAGTYTVQQISISNNGCRDTIQQTFTVNGVPVSNFTVQNPSLLCSNQTVSLLDGSSINVGSLIRLEIYWDYTNNPAIKTVDNSPVPGKTYTHNYPEFGSPASQTFTVKYVTYSGVNCVSTSTQTVTLLATPTLNFDPLTAVCSDVPAFQVTQAQLLNGLPGAGVFSGTGINATGFFNPAAAGGGVYTIRYTYTGTNTCVNYVERSIEVYPTPPLNAGPDKVVLEGGVVALTPAQNAGVPVTYLWSPAIGLNDPTSPSPLASPADDITYTLTVTSDKGCKSSDQVFVKVLKALVIPNIFSPNGDGIHDKWEISYLESYPGCTVDIYNRYGQLIYHSVGYSKPWDGTINGSTAPVGTYYYIIDPKNGRKKAAGYVDIIR